MTMNPSKEGEHGDADLLHIAFGDMKSDRRNNPKMAEPQQIGDALSEAIREADASNPDDETVIGRLLKKPEGKIAVFLTLLAGVSAFATSGVGHEILNSLSGQR